MKIAKVMVDLALDREFDYMVPETLDRDLFLGSRVEVPFGKRRVRGYVVGLAEKSDCKSLKSISSVCGEHSYLSDTILQLARWMSDYYFAPVEHCIRTVLPGAVRKSGRGFKKQMCVFPLDNPDDQIIAGLTEKQKQAFKLVAEEKGVLLSDLSARLGITAAPIKVLEKKGLVKIEKTILYRDPSSNRRILRTSPLKLTGEQQVALDMVNSAVDGESPRVVLLHGVTGSGKTEVYMQAIARVLDRKSGEEKGEGVIVLVPEISLTPQTVGRFRARFGDRVGVLHSHLSEGERHDEWHRIREGKVDIVIGARSAVFAPIRKPLLIVVDEEHEPTYKQEDAPRYNARDVAVMRGHIDGCAVVLGSATPALESWNNALNSKYRLARITKRVDDRRMPVMNIMDMRRNAGAKEKGGVLSPELLEAIRARMEQGEQVMLFLNRRGFATSLVCPQCGYVAGCENCSVSYTYHRTDEILRCHICGAGRKVPQRCPGCQDPSFKYSGVGTQRIESVVTKCFPNRRIQRIDADMTRTKDSYERILGDFSAGKIDILIGTQMIAKGLHFPNVTLVGVIYADLSLHMPDFRAGERTFQLLAQVAGRAGRGEVGGQVIVQTYTPNHPAIQAVRRLDYEGFADAEIEFRRELNYPPFSHLICVTLKGPAEDKVSFVSAAISRGMKRRLGNKAIVSDSAPAPLARAKGMYRYQVMMRCRSVSTMTAPLRAVLGEIKFPDKMTCSVDVDAMSLL